MEHRSYIQKNRRGAFTLAEFLVVIAITMILAGVSFVAAIRYQSRLRRMEMDRTAKEIFLAAQNNLSLAKSGGIMERLLSLEEENGAGTSESGTNASADKIGIALTEIAGNTGIDADGLYYILYQPGEDADNPTEEIRERLLPFGSIDETVRTDGSYLIIYNPEAGAVREVWYSDRYVFQGNATEFTELSEIASDPDKRERFHGNPVGHYAGDSLTEPGKKDPDQVGSVTLELHNEDILYAIVKDNNIGFTMNYTLRMWIEGLSSGAVGWFQVSDSHVRIDEEATSGKSTIVLDDITTDGQRFADFNSDSSMHFQKDGMQFIPGEDIRVYVDSVSNETGKVIAVSRIYQTNSIFQGITGGRVQVAGIRHLENLDSRISEFKPKGNAEQLGLQTSQPDGAYMAVQQADISWALFRQNVADFHFNPNEVDQKKEQVAVRYVIDKTTSWSRPGSFAPLEPSYKLDYEGNSHAISDLRVDTAGAGGCFGTVAENLTVENLIITRPNITSDDNAGGLIGYGKKEANAASLEISVENVLVQYPVITSKGVKDGTETKAVDAGALVGAFNGTTLTVKSVMAANTYRTRVSDAASVDQNPPDNAEAFKIEAETGAAGGLIGSVTGNVTLSGCAASVYVDAQSYAGGLVANVNTPAAGTPKVLIENCYVAGHTANGACLTDLYPGAKDFDTTKGRYNIVSTGELAGGLAAVLPTGSVVKRSYVTASIWSKGINSADEVDMTTFVTKCGKMNNGETITGKKASAFSYCYSSSIVSGGENAENVKGKEILDYSNTDKLEKYFAENATFTKKQAFPYDTTLASTYPMPTVLQLMQEDPETSSTIRSDAGEGTSQSKQIFRFSRVHVGDWVKGKKETTAGGMNIHNGNRLWVDYVMDMPQGAEQKYLTFAVTGAESGITMYYAVDVSNAKYSFSVGSCPTGTPNTSFSERKERCRLEKIETADGKICIRLYIDDLSMPFSSYQNMYVNDTYDERTHLKAGEDIDIRCYEEIRDWNASDTPKPCNSMFERIKVENGIYTAYVANSRHLENLNKCANPVWGGESNRIHITHVIQDADIAWQYDPELLRDDVEEAYSKEISEAYGKVIIYEGGSELVQSGSFYPIQNDDILTYDGKNEKENRNYIISNLKVNMLGEGQKSSAMFQTSKHLSVSNLNLKNPVMISQKNNAAAVIANAGEYYNEGYYNTADYLELTNIHVYGDETKIVGGNNVGGIVASVCANKIEIQNVSFYGKNALIGSISGDGGEGGLVGFLKTSGTMKIENSMFSAYLDGTKKTDPTGGVGGLVGKLDLTRQIGETGPNMDDVTILNCYVAGHNLPYVGDADAMLKSTEGISIVGNKYVGGLIGFGKGPLQIKNSFSMAGTYATEIGNGGLIGGYQTPDYLLVQDSYFGGTIKKKSEPNYCAGIMIGRILSSDGQNPLSEFNGEFRRCSYIYRESFGTSLNLVGSVNGEISGVTMCTATQMDTIKADQIIAAESYDDSLPPIYPYKVWTTESGKTIYRGDWIQ